MILLIITVMKNLMATAGAPGCLKDEIIRRNSQKPRQDTGIERENQTDF